MNILNLAPSHFLWKSLSNLSVWLVNLVTINNLVTSLVKGIVGECMCSKGFQYILYTIEVVQTLAECLHYHNPAIKHIHNCNEMGVAVTVQYTTFFFTVVMW